VPYSLDDKLVVGISSRALFDLADANAVYEADGLERYREYQRGLEDKVLAPGTGFPLVKALLALNERVAADERLVEVIVISRNDADSAMRVFNSIEEYKLDITRGAFTNGGESWRYLGAFHCSLFLSVEPAAVVAALRDNYPAALLLPPPDTISSDLESGPVRVAFDGDAVLFSDEAQRVYDAGKLPAFYRHETARAAVPLPAGPLRPFLDALGRVQARLPADEPPIRTALVTARDAPAHRRVITTLRSWQVRIDETFFLGGLPKVDVLRVLRPHIFFDDQLTHLEAAASTVPSGHVPVPVQLGLLAEEQLPAKQPPAVRRRRNQAAVKKTVELAQPGVRPDPMATTRERLARAGRSRGQEPSSGTGGKRATAARAGQPKH
jgi:5'-nucleotidase